MAADHTTFEVVRARPARQRHHPRRLYSLELKQAVLDTANTGGAVKIPLDGRSDAILRAALMPVVRARGLRLVSRYIREQRAVYLWADVG